jgi:hypothetical protein
MTAATTTDPVQREPELATQQPTTSLSLSACGERPVRSGGARRGVIAELVREWGRELVPILGEAKGAHPCLRLIRTRG